MRLGLSTNLRTEQRLSQSPQMIQAMQVLQTPMIELQDQIEQELQDNVFLELKEQDNDSDQDGENQDRSRDRDQADEGITAEERMQRELTAELDRLDNRTDDGYRTRTVGSAEDVDRKYEALYNTPSPDLSLHDHLLSQTHLLTLSPELDRVVEHIVYSLDDDGRLAESAEQVANDLLVPVPLADQAITLVRTLEPPGVGARDLRDCMLLQLDRKGYVRPLTRRLVERHLEDLATNKLPKIAKETSSTIDDVKESWEWLRENLEPHPGSDFTTTRNATVAPDVLVEEVDGELQVHAERGALPEISISRNYRKLLEEAKKDPKIYEHLRRKIDAAKWFIEAVHQRQTTIQRIASEIVKRQEKFLRHGIQHLKPMKMQEVADSVGVHISTVSRAVSGKFIQTPQGIFDMKRFFSGGTVTDSGKMVSQQAVKETLRQIVDAEDKSKPLSDDQLVEALAEKGVHIARRTVTKYRKALSIDASTQRREF